MNGFTELRLIPAEPQEENAEIIIALLEDSAFTTFEFREGEVLAWADENAVSEADIEAIWQQLAAFCTGTAQTRLVPRENWNETWEKSFFEPVVVGNRVHIRAPFHPPAQESTALELIIEPKMSFGTGHHATTRLMSTLMLNYEASFAGANVLDMGTGTGVLGILACKLGANSVTGVDNEPWAAENAAENALVNHVTGFKAMLGDADLLKNMENALFDVVLANIHLNVLLADGPAYLRVLKPGGLLLLSGFYANDKTLIERNFAGYGAFLLAGIEEGGWRAVVLKK
jgi:ribosomal protein L11 methyltransferase